MLLGVYIDRAQPYLGFINPCLGFIWDVPSPAARRLDAHLSVRFGFALSGFGFSVSNYQVHQQRRARQFSSVDGGSGYSGFRYALSGFGFRGFSNGLRPALLLNSGIHLLPRHILLYPRHTILPHRHTRMLPEHTRLLPRHSCLPWIRIRTWRFSGFEFRVWRRI